MWKGWFVGVLLVGCGDGHAASDASHANDAPRAIDAAEIDAAIDAMPDATVGGIRVRVLAGPPVAGVNVLFHAPDGTFLARGLTDANGEVLGDVPDGSSATVVTTVPLTTQIEIETIMGAARGDVLVFGASRAFFLPGPMTIDVPTAPGTSPVYLAFSDCGFASQTATTSLMFPITCSGATGNIMALSKDGPAVTQFAELDDVAMVPASTATVAAWTPAVTHATTITGIPGSPPVQGSVRYLRDGRVFYTHSLPPGAATETYTDANGGTSWQVAATLGGGPGNASLTMMAAVDDPTAIVFDVAALVPPAVTGILTNNGDVVSWTTEPATPTSVLAVIMKLDDANELIARWSIRLPGADQPTSAGVPTLPDDLVDRWGHLTPDTIIGGVTLEFSTQPYETFRLHAFSDLDGDTIVQRSSVLQAP